ncbi:hypothetical protein ACOALA_20810 (plasmid) [Alicyclobacillus acidoterrestris]|uniref:hypothetical protein n=1 Tax=Alicyclobacillus acidoterrestris TaxID=1450 RepID=UPI003F52A4BD
MKPWLVGGAALATLVGTVSPVFADTTTNFTSTNQPVISQSQLSNLKLNVQHKSDQETIITATDNGSDLVADVVNDGTKIIYTYTLNG